MSVWETLVDIVAVATFLLLCTSIPCYIIFQAYFLTRAPTQRTVINSLVVNLSFVMELFDIILCSFVLLPYLLPMAEFMTHHPLVACAEGLLVWFLAWAITVSLAVISVHRLLSTLFYGRYAEWSQNIMLAISLTVVYGYPLLAQLMINVFCKDVCSVRQVVTDAMPTTTLISSQRWKMGCHQPV